MSNCKVFLFFIIALFLGSPVLAATYDVGGGNNDFTGSSGIVDCINSLDGVGGVCEVYDGSYSGGTISGSGVDLDNMIIARAAAGQTSITITSGFSFGTEDYVRIGEVGYGFTIQSSSFSCSPGGSYLQIVGNELDASGVFGQNMNCHDWMFDSNNADNSPNRDGSDAFRIVYDRANQYRTVIRNNIMGGWASDSSNHVDFIQHYCYDTDANYGWTLTEGNIFHDISGSNQHFQLAHCLSNADDSYNIIRYNVMSNVSSGFMATDNHDSSATYSDWVAYNNTMYEGATSNGWWYNEESSPGGTFEAPNNLNYNSVNTNLFGVYRITGICDANMYYSTSGNLSTYSTNCYSGARSVQANTNPIFYDADAGTSYDFSLAYNSPAIDSGTYLTTTTNSGSSSTSLTVNDPIFFQDGWAGADPDCIAIGTVSNTACIVRDSINYSTGAITLDTPLTWSSSASVWLFKKSDGEQVLYGSAPDIGAVEYTADITPPELSSAAINGTSVSNTFTESVTNNGVTTEFVLTCSGAGAQTMTYVSGSGTANWVFSVPSAIANGETCTEAFTTSADLVEDDAGNDLDTFSGESVTNNTPAEAPSVVIPAKAMVLGSGQAAIIDSGNGALLLGN